MIVLVTGAGGYVGAHAIDRLIAAGHTPVASARRAIQVPCEVRRADLSEPAALQGLLAGVDAVLHCAARVGAGTPEDFQRDNVTATQRLVAHLDGRRLVHLSSVAVYGLGRHVDTHEDAPIAPGGDPYAVSKARAEDVVRAAGSPWVILRPGVIWGGPHDRRLMPPVRRVAALGAMLYPGPCRSPMPFAHIDNVCDLALAALAPDAPSGLALNATDGSLADGVSVSFRTFIQRCAAAAGTPLRFERTLPLAPLRAAIRAGTSLARRLGAPWPTSLRPELLTLFNTPCTFSTARARAALSVAPLPREHLRV